MLDERTKIILRIKPSNCLILRLIFVLSSIMVQKLYVPAHLWRPFGEQMQNGDEKVVFNSTRKKLTDVNGALPLNNKASYMIKFILVSQK